MLLLNQGPSEPCYATEHNSSALKYINMPIASSDKDRPKFGFGAKTSDIFSFGYGCVIVKHGFGLSA